MGNFLVGQTSPYLLQHAENPVNWYPWCEEAFAKARKEEKPVFLSIGYSTCHWCHVMAHESFEDEQVAEILNRYFISIKVDKEERPDIDAIYMAACQAFTGSGGWPTTVFLTPEKKPFYAGTYFPKQARFGQIGLIDLLNMIHEKWEEDRREILELSEDVLTALKQGQEGKDSGSALMDVFGHRLIEGAVNSFRHSFDSENGGFGHAPKFPTPHNLLFLLRYYEKSGNQDALQMAEKTLQQMYRGGLFDHIGGGFCRYSTDARFLVPHFEKMLYDNALLIMAYTKAYQITKNDLYRFVAEKTAEFCLREMAAPDGGFYSAQDADSEGTEGKYYVFSPEEIIAVLGEEEGRRFNQQFDITEEGNFEGKNIPNLLRADETRGSANIVESDEKSACGETSDSTEECLKKLYEYRKKRHTLHLDDKILTGWNGLMTAALCRLYRVTHKKRWLVAAQNAENFVLNKMSEEDILFVSYRKGRSAHRGFLEDYAFQIFALLDLYECTWEEKYLKAAVRFHEKAVRDFYDLKCGGFYLYGKDHEQMILRPKETYDGAVFSGNSAMAHNLMRLGYLIGEGAYEWEAVEHCDGGIFDQDCQKLAAQQMKFLAVQAQRYPAGQTMFLASLLDILDPPDKVTVVMDRMTEDEMSEDKACSPCEICCIIPLDTVIIIKQPTVEYPLKDGKTTFYVCKGRSCLAPVNDLNEIFRN